MTQRPRKFDLILFGATGYTGKLTGEQVLHHTPSTLRWAIAGRSPQKLELLAHEYNRLYPDRVPVQTFIADLTEFSIERLVSSTRCLISVVGPFIKYGTPVLEACAVYGTHYVDSTGEYPWVYDMVKRCHKTAKNKGAIIVPQCGLESAPLDLGTYALVKAIRDELGFQTADVRFSVQELKGSLSGGTFETVMAVFETATLQEISEASRFDALSPVKGPEQPFQKPIRNDPDLGVLAPWFTATTDRAIVFRSWGLYDGGEYYGPNFTWAEYRSMSNYLTATVWMILVKVAALIPIFGPFRWLAKKLFRFRQGEGPSEEERQTLRAEWHGIAEADDGSETPAKAFVTVNSALDGYTLTAMLMVHVAMSILFDKGTLAAKLGGGILTPASFASPDLFRRLDRAGLKIDAKIL